MTAATIPPSSSSSSTLNYGTPNNPNTPNADGQVSGVGATTNLPGPSSVTYGYNGSDPDFDRFGTLDFVQMSTRPADPTELGNGTNQHYNASQEMCDTTTGTASCTAAPAASNG